MATSRLDGQKYALKVMKHRYANLEKIKKDKEIKALKSLAHPHIIKLIDVLYSPLEGTPRRTQRRWRWSSNSWTATSTSSTRTSAPSSPSRRSAPSPTTSSTPPPSSTRRASSTATSNPKIYSSPLNATSNWQTSAPAKVTPLTVRYALAAALHRVHLHALVSISRVPAD